MKFIQSLLFIFILAGCGTSTTTDNDPEESKNSEDPAQSCPTYEVDGQKLKEIPEEEMDRYEQKLGNVPEERKHTRMAAIQSERKETFQAEMQQEGLTMEDLKSIGGMFIDETSIVVQLKQDLSEEEREPVEQIVERVRDTYNEGAVLIDEVSVSQKESGQRLTEVMNTLKKHETLRPKISSFSTCGRGSMDVEVTLLQELDEEETDYIRSTFDYPVYTKVSAMETSGYVTETREGEILVDSTWFSEVAPEAEIGSYVKVTHGSVQLSYPGQASAFETEIRELRQPEGADKTDREAVRKALEDFEKGPLDITEAAYDREKDQWNITVSIGSATEDDTKETVTVPD
ncbi:hypothetical protein [Salimicrobium halophilum]|uniref:Uncharacterized protein n=1 Tax=Salimicrobium halophilum TaxID=86666 RepID=A0A1G8R1U4_9BACI|nr:hypothetical protein [Salimicrobium halophilum]SDJ10928.1 hypothetical protein SAMN04490247_0768 [Salimicrobium halophilum]